MADNIILKFNNAEAELTFIGPLNRNLEILEMELDIKLEHVANTLLLEGTEKEEN